MNRRGRKKSRAWIWILVAMVVLGIVAAEPDTETIGEVRQVQQILSETDEATTANLQTTTANLQTTSANLQTTSAKPPEENNVTVYIPRSDGAECYHYDKNCSRMKNPRAVTLKEAVREGYRPCSKCVCGDRL